MSGVTMRKMRFLPVWEEEKENSWLESMSEQGWHLTGRGYFSYYFERGDSREYNYRYDFKLTTDKDYDDYRQIFSESGWEHVATFANWHYFRTKKSAGANDIYTDVASKKARFKRLFMLMAALASINLVILSNNIFLLSITEDGLSGTPVFLFFLWGIMAFVAALLVYAAIRILISLKKLKKSISE